MKDDQTHNENTPLLVFCEKMRHTSLRVHLVSDAGFNRHNGCNVALTRTKQSSPALFA
jgi:hypothetical protein